ncbi:MAG: UbiA family prenyltransferase [Chitinophagaceae bacterium]
MNKPASHQYPIHSLQFWKAYLVQMRPYLLFISGVAGAAGIAMGKGSDTAGWNWSVALIPFFLGYGFGQALTDCFQTDTDKLSAPYRPLSKGIVSIRSVFIISIIGLLSSGLIFFWLHPVCFRLSLFAVFGLATYSFIKKHFWFAGPFYNAWIVALLPVMGYFATKDRAITQFHSGLYPYIFITFFSYASFVLIGYLKDIEADKATNYKTFSVVYGWNKTILLGDIFALLTLFIYWWQPGKNLWEILLSLAGTIIIISGQVVGHTTKIKNEKGALIPILSTVRGFVLLHIAIVIHFQPQYWTPALGYYSLFEWALINRPSKYQV